MCNNKFYFCEHCGNLIEMIHDAGVSVMCCGQLLKSEKLTEKNCQPTKFTSQKTKKKALEIAFQSQFWSK